MTTWGETMPIYEMYCPECNTIFSFLSRAINTTKRPGCPRCKKRQLERQVSLFAMTGKAGDKSMEDDLPVDESKMEQAMMSLADEAEGINEDDPKQAAQLMRKFSQMTGIQFGEGMETAIDRMEAGEDPDKIEKEMGDLMEDDDLFVLPEKSGGSGDRTSKRRSAPDRDPTLYEM